MWSISLYCLITNELLCECYLYYKRGNVDPRLLVVHVALGLRRWQILRLKEWSNESPHFLNAVNPTQKYMTRYNDMKTE